MQPHTIHIGRLLQPKLGISPQARWLKDVARLVELGPIDGATPAVHGALLAQQLDTRGGHLIQRAQARSEGINRGQGRSNEYQ